MKKWLVLCAAVLLVGCSEEAKKDVEQKKAAVNDAVDTVIIQKGKMQAGQRAAQKVRDVSAQHQEDLNQVMDE